MSGQTCREWLTPVWPQHRASPPFITKPGRKLLKQSSHAAFGQLPRPQLFYTVAQAPKAELSHLVLIGDLWVSVSYRSMLMPTAWSTKLGQNPPLQIARLSWLCSAGLRAWRCLHRPPCKTRAELATLS